MNYTILISSGNYKLNDIKSAISLDDFDCTYADDDQLVIEMRATGNSIRIERDDNISNDLDEKELENIHKAIPAPEFYFVHYSSLKAVKKLLKHMANREDVFIDNDCDLIVSGKTFVNICDNKPDWDWVAEYGA